MANEGFPEKVADIRLEALLKYCRKRGITSLKKDYLRHVDNRYYVDKLKFFKLITKKRFLVLFHKNLLIDYYRVTENSIIDASKSYERKFSKYPKYSELEDEFGHVGSTGFVYEDFRKYIVRNLHLNVSSPGMQEIIASLNKATKQIMTYHIEGLLK